MEKYLEYSLHGNFSLYMVQAKTILFLKFNIVLHLISFLKVKFSCQSCNVNHSG